MGTKIGRLQDALAILEQVLVWLEEDVAWLTAVDCQQLAQNLQIALQINLATIQTKPDAIYFANQFITAVRQTPSLAQRIPPIEQGMFNLRQVYAPEQYHEATPQRQRQWQIVGQQIQNLAKQIIQHCQKK